MKDWTIMIYMAGDNNLSVDMAYAIQQIKKVVGEKNNNFNLFVYYDGYSPAVPTLYCDFSDPDAHNQYFRSYLIQDKLYHVEEEFDENSAAAKSVINFIDWCVNKVRYEEGGETKFGRKAKRYALIFSGHSLGFQSIGLMKDEKANYYMTLRKINWLLKRITGTKEKLEAETAKKVGNRKWSEKLIKEEKSVILGQPLDILGFDSCVMSMLEVGYQFTTLAKTMIASEGSIPNAGWTYAQILGDLANASPTKEIVYNVVQNFIRCQDNYTIGEISVDMAAWDLVSLPSILMPFEKLVSNLLLCFKDEESIIYKQMQRVVLQVHWKCQSYMMEQNVDLGDFCGLLIEEIDSLKVELEGKTIKLLDKVRKNCEDVLKEIKSSIILSGFSGGKYQYSNGISLYFPWSVSGYNVSSKNYKVLNFIKNTKAGRKWNRFLYTYLTNISFRKAKTIGNFGENGTVYQTFTYKEHINTGILASMAGNIVNVDINSDSNSHRIPENGTHKIPENGTHKMFGVLSLFLDEFMDYKNIQTFWNTSGFSKSDEMLLTEIGQFQIATKSSEEK